MQNFVRTLQSIWYGIPFPVRLISSIGLVAAIVLVIFRPLLIMAMDGAAGVMVLFKGFSDVSSDILEKLLEAMSSLLSLRTYEAVFKTLLRTLKLIMDMLPARDAITVVGLLALILLAAVAMRKQLKIP